MFRRLLGLALGLGCMPATGMAQELTAGEAAVLPRLIDSVCIDLVEDSNGCEQVIVLANAASPDRADLMILRDWRTEPASEPLLIARNIAFNGAMWGMAPELDVAENGSLLLSSQQSGIGRFPWFQTYTIAYRDDRFVLAGFSYSTYDRAMGGGMNCDVNLLTGDYQVNAWSIDPETEDEVVALEETGQSDPLDLDVATLGTNAPFPAACEMGMAAWDVF